ncbi:MAG: hypothetical protein COT59_00230 [Candidatus Nealsonbacteria bacterium CG09_land_8_20_14_0_10_42_14]|uniref:GH10 domain-containing protein n=1 Tax=Candidatus Nealsonbacteria bacterium CG09_land_8_20_14_0_10_42_14 TaxID=1974707 RepID=A0A2H0X006_9BACT|nr:MAG: hypothetical protein COT59_00230 [Candidatus Nealsonbacteria bacterium CG09_land_8_20_14_0_10_42_14]
MRKFLKKTLLGILIFLLLFAGYLFIGTTEPAESITWGVNFSQKHAEFLGLDWKKTYVSLIDDLGVKNIKLAVYWDLVENEEGKYNFNDLDWQIQKAEEAQVKLLLVVGMKAPRWPECHIPGWAAGMSKIEQQERISKLIENIVLHYRDSDAIWAWQVENEPFFPFGECPWTDRDFLKKEIDLVKSLDERSRPVVISESGEYPLWVMAASYGDIVGVTMYKKVWVHQVGIYLTYFFPPVFYHRKAEIVRKLFNKEVIGVELQAEPWGPKLLYDSPLEEQEKTMNLEQFKYNIEFAKKTGLDTHYLWGAEWWYWMKVKQDRPEIWDEAQKLF